MFLVSEVHPFDDGNGRAARVMMNAELVAGNQARIIIPIVFRDDYLGALRQLTRYDDPSVLIKALRFAHDYTSSIDFTDKTTATMQLERTNAFNAADSPKRLVLLGRSQNGGIDLS
jgi:fido (protein-threonine AMPylation protein)